MGNASLFSSVHSVLMVLAAHTGFHRISADQKHTLGIGEGFDKACLIIEICRDSGDAFGL